MRADHLAAADAPGEVVGLGRLGDLRPRTRLASEPTNGNRRQTAPVRVWSNALAPNTADGAELLAVLDSAPRSVRVDAEGHRDAPVAVLDQHDLAAVLAVERGRVVLVRQAKRHRRSAFG